MAEPRPRKKLWTRVKAPGGKLKARDGIEVGEARENDPAHGDQYSGQKQLSTSIRCW